MFDADRFSKFSRLLNAFAYVIRFANHVTSRDKSLINKPLTSAEINDARICLLKEIQTSFWERDRFCK